MRGRSPSHGKDIFENSCLKTTSSCTLLGGVLYSGIDLFPTLFFSFPFEFVSEKHSFSFITFSFFFHFFYSPINIFFRGCGK